MQKSIVVEDLSPLALYALNRAKLVPQPAPRARPGRDDDDDDDDGGGGGGGHQTAAAVEREQVLLTDDDIKVMID